MPGSSSTFRTLSPAAGARKFVSKKAIVPALEQQIRLRHFAIPRALVVLAPLAVTVAPLPQELDLAELISLDNLDSPL